MSSREESVQLRVSSSGNKLKGYNARVPAAAGVNASLGVVPGVSHPHPELHASHGAVEAPVQPVSKHRARWSLHNSLHG
jgi:hypothetical protein